MPRISLVAAGLMAILALARPGAAFPAAGVVSAPEQPQVPEPPVPAVGPPISPAEVERIRRALNQPKNLNLDDQQLRFYLEIVAIQPTFAEYARGYDFINGPTKRGNPMTHQEFVNRVTPKEMYSTAGITPSEQFQFALTNYLGQSLIKKALEELKQAKDANEIQAIRERINRELDALTGVIRSTPR